jgi:hypothetical protein
MTWHEFSDSILTIIPTTTLNAHSNFASVSSSANHDVAVAPSIASAQPTSTALSFCSWATVNHRHSDKGEGDALSATIRHLVGTQPADVFDENLEHLRLLDSQGLQIAVGNAVANDLDDQQVAEDSASAQRFTSRFD